MSTGEFAEEADQIGVGIDAVGLAGLDQRIEVGTGMGAGHRIGEQPVAASDDEGADGVLAQVVVDRPRAVLDIAGEPRPLCRKVMQYAVSSVILD